MKKHLALVAAVAVLSSSAYATKARMGALGQGRDGSYYINDTRNVFYNASAIVDTTKYIVAELGEAKNGGPDGNASPATSTIDRWNAPNAEGGFFGQAGRVAYGVYLGFQDAEANGACRNNTWGLIHNAGTVNDDVPVLGCVGRGAAVAAGVVTPANQEFMKQDNRVDLFVGADMFVKWGLSYYWAQGTDQVLGTGNPTTLLGRSTETSGARVGLEWNGFKYWFNITLRDHAEIAQVKTALAEGAKPENVYNSKRNWNTGLSWNYKNWTAYATIEQREVTEDVNNAAITSNQLTHARMARQAYVLGAGYQKALSSKGTLFGNLEFQVKNARHIRRPVYVTPQAGEALSAGMTGFDVPLNIGFETEVFSWLTARASVTQNVASLHKLYLQRFGAGAQFADVYAENGKRLRPLGTTEVNAGATLEFGKLKVDGLVGTTVGGAPGSNNKRGVLALDQLLSRVGASYWF